MNPERYSGRNRISIAMRNKFTELWVPSILNKGELKEIVMFYLGNIPKNEEITRKWWNSMKISPSQLRGGLDRRRNRKVSI